MIGIPAFEFAAPTQVVFGRGAVERCGSLVPVLGSRALIVTGRSPARGDRLASLLRATGVEVTSFAVDHEPDAEIVGNGAVVARRAHADVVVGIGGGSAIDAAKAISALAANDGDLLDYLEVVGRGRPLSRPALPCVTIPTTAGTGSEVTRNAVVAIREHRVKVSLRSALMAPRLAIVDPDLTTGLPQALTASTGLDALTQLVEPYVSSRANLMTDALCADAIPRAARALRQAFRDGQDLAAREEMSLASLFSGIALANAGLGAVHGFAGPIGGMFDAPHGAVCAALLPHVFDVNARALTERSKSPALGARFDQVAQWLTGSPSAVAADGVVWLRELVHELAIPPLRTYGVTADSVPALVGHARRASSMKGNPIELTEEELGQILDAAI